MSDIMGMVYVLAVMAATGYFIEYLFNRWRDHLLLILERERLRDRLFRDSINTIHYLRVENDNLTAMVMALQKERGE